MENFEEILQGTAHHTKNFVEPFLNAHWDRSSPLLLGYSGGPDSKALLYALLESGIRPSLAHVDHGWREESGDEALQLQRESETLGCPFYTTRLALKDQSEDEARKARLQFFHSLFDQTPFQALLLAHQADDLAETVLKRVLEGAHLPFLGGMEPVSLQWGMTIWRPLLNVRRSEILTFIKERSLEPIYDPSNLDPAYLRARMRLEILPVLNQAFGKETTDNLALLSERAAELRAYLDRKIASVKVHKGGWGAFVEMERLEKIERRHLLQRIAREEGVTLSRPVIETLLKWVEIGGEGKFLWVKQTKIFVEKGSVFFFSSALKDSPSISCK